MPNDFDILHSLRVKGLASDPVLAAMSGVSPTELPDRLAALIDGGLVVRREGRLAGSSLTPAGRTEYQSALANDSETTAAHAQLDRLYTAFLPINGRFKDVCHDWQMRTDTEPNDHSDAEFDAEVIGRLASVHREMADHLETVSQALPRYGRYRIRLTDALARVREGDNAAFARPMYDSYHDIWMELHQDLLLSLGRERGEHDEG